MRKFSPIKKKYLPKFNPFSASPWQIITSGTEAAAFHGKIVAYRTDTAYFGDPGNQLQNGGTTFFGYIDNFARTWREPADRGPRLARILKPEGKPGLCAITETMLNYKGPAASLKMREATKAELALLRQAIISGAATLEPASAQAMRALGLDTRNPSGPKP